MPLSPPHPSLLQKKFWVHQWWELKQYKDYGTFFISPVVHPNIYYPETGIVNVLVQVGWYVCVL